MVAVAKAQEVIFEIQDNYQKQTYRNRAYIAHSNGKLLLNVPIKHTKDGSRQKTKDVLVENDFLWQSHHWKSLQSAYRTSPFFEFYEDDLEPLFTNRVTHLMRHNLDIFKILIDLIGIDITTTYTETFQKESAEIDGRFLVEAKKEKDYGFDRYTQVLGEQHGFLKNLSVLDLLFNEGPNTLSFLQSQKLFLH